MNEESQEMKKSICVLLLLFAFACNRGAGTGHVSVVSYVTGGATLQRTTGSEPLTVGMKLNVGDIIKTSEAGTAVLIFVPEEIRVEVQPNSEFSVRSYDEKARSFHLQRGNVWMQVNRQPGSKTEVQLTTPTSVASVRGTKFYTSRQGDMELKCQCEGTLEYSVQETSFRGVSEQDTLTVTRGGRTVVLTPIDLKTVGYAHNHSTIDGSPVGKKNEMTAEQFQRFMEIVNKKFEEGQ